MIGNGILGGYLRLSVFFAGKKPAQMDGGFFCYISGKQWFQPGNCLETIPQTPALGASQSLFQHLISSRPAEPQEESDEKPLHRAAGKAWRLGVVDPNANHKYLCKRKLLGAKGAEILT